MTKHTPGPWRVEPVSYPERAHPQVYAGKKLVADPRNSKDVPAPESDHNARLIAAAPDLLVACRQLENALAFALMGKPLPNTQIIIEAAQATIVKAGGWMGIDPDEPAA